MTSYDVHKQQTPPPNFAPRRRGAFTHPDPAIRGEAVRLTKKACEAAKALGCDEVVVWSAYCGYDYSFAADYKVLFERVAEAFREVCDAHPDVKVSLEYKPTDENTRFFAVPSTGAAVLLAERVDRKNFGLTLDFGHCIMAGENPAQSAAMAGDKLFGVQLNDGYSRLAAEDGMQFGSVHPVQALEFLYWLRRGGYKGHFYFDTFPHNEDPVAEAEANIETVKRMWEMCGQMEEEGIEHVMKSMDAMKAIAAVNKVLFRRR